MRPTIVEVHEGGVFGSWNVGWTNPTNAITADSTYATATLTESGHQTKGLVFRGIPLDLPPGAIIRKIDVKPTWGLDVAGSVDPQVRLTAVYPDFSASSVKSSPTLSNVQTTDTYSFTGAAVHALTAAQVNDRALFAVAVQPKNPDGTDRVVSADDMQLTVTYQWCSAPSFGA